MILHGFGGDRKGFPVEGTGEGYFERLARILAEQGFSSLRIDFRGSGESDGTFDITTFTGQVSDAAAALDLIKTFGTPVNHRRIGVVGHSQGGIVSSLLSAQDKRVKSLALWAAPSAPSHDYEGLLLVNGMKQGLALQDGGIITLPVFVEGEYIFDITLSKQFFVEVFTTVPLVTIKDYKRPMMYVSPLQDNIVWPERPQFLYPGSAAVKLKKHGWQPIRHYRPRHTARRAIRVPRGASPWPLESRRRHFSKGSIFKLLWTGWSSGRTCCTSAAYRTGGSSTTKGCIRWRECPASQPVSASRMSHFIII